MCFHRIYLLYFILLFLPPFVWPWLIWARGFFSIASMNGSVDEMTRTGSHFSTIHFFFDCRAGRLLFVLTSFLILPSLRRFLADFFLSCRLGFEALILFASKSHMYSYFLFGLPFQKGTIFAFFLMLSSPSEMDAMECSAVSLFSVLYLFVFHVCARVVILMMNEGILFYYALGGYWYWLMNCTA